MIIITIKNKIMIPMMALTVITAIAVLISNISQFSNYVDASVNDRVNSASTVADNEIETLKSRAHSISLYLAANSEIIEAIENNDRENLLNHASQMYKEAGADFCTIADSNGIALARPHKPESYGDDVTGMPSVKSALSGKSLAVIEPGVSVQMSVCSAAPIYDRNNKLIGVVSVGYRLDTNKFVDSIKSLLNCEATIFLGDERISTTVVKDDGTRATGTKAADNVSSTVLSGKEYSGTAKILNRDAITKYTPIIGADGKVLGMMFVGQYLNEKTDTVAAFIKTGLLIMLILLAMSAPIILFITKRIVSPINTMVKAAEDLAVGNTVIDVQINTKDEMRHLANAFNNMIENTRKQVQVIETIAEGDLTVPVEIRSENDLMNNALLTMLDRNNNAFSQIVNSANLVSTGAHQIADSSQSLAQGATEQAATVEQLSSTINEINSKTKDNADMADKAAVLTVKIKDSAKKGSKQMNQMVQAVKEINEANQSISKIIKVIDDIAFQTNILALNAAVEAARAGQNGKGFAVVADEVRNLASKSAEAAKDTDYLIENSISKSEFGVNIANETYASLDEIVSGIDESNRIVDEIAKSSKQQSIAITQINDGINQVSQVVQQNSAASEECAAASEKMNEQASVLRKLVSGFKLI